VYPYTYFSIECDTNGSVTTGKVDFTASDGSNPKYDVTVTYLWGVKGPNEFVVINRQNEESITRTYEHDIEGTYIVGVRYVFGKNSGCEGHEAEQLFQIWYERGNCDVLDDYSGQYYSIGNSNGPPSINNDVEDPQGNEEAAGEELKEEVVVLPATPKPKPEEVVVLPTTPEPTTPEPTDSKTLPPSLRPSVPPTGTVTSSSTPISVSQIVEPMIPLPPCGNGRCDPGETYKLCQRDCPAPTPTPIPKTSTNERCGNGNCDPGETYRLCPRDCPVDESVELPKCGNGNCDPGETYILCPRDCLAPTSAPTAIPIEDDDTSLDGNESAAAPTTDSSNQKRIMFIVAGAAGGVCGIAVTMILGMILIRRSRKKKKKKWDGTWNGKTLDNKSGMEIATTTKTATITKSHTKNNSDSNVSDSIEHSGTSGGANYHGQSYFGAINPTDEGDDVSTLGDPYMGDAVHVMIGADQTVGGET
jgi:hypothetical protein